MGGRRPRRSSARPVAPPPATGAQLARAHLPYQRITAAGHAALVGRPAAVCAVGRLLTAPMVGRALAGGWGIFWNELLDGAAARSRPTGGGGVDAGRSGGDGRHRRVPLVRCGLRRRLTSTAWKDCGRPSRISRRTGRPTSRSMAATAPRAVKANTRSDAPASRVSTGPPMTMASTVVTRRSTEVATTHVTTTRRPLLSGRTIRTATAKAGQGEGDGRGPPPVDGDDVQPGVALEGREGGDQGEQGGHETGHSGECRTGRTDQVPDVDGVLESAGELGG